MLQLTNHTFNYTTFRGLSGFALGEAIPDLDSSNIISINSTVSTTYFLPIGGGGFSKLSTIESYANALFHPNNSPWSFDAEGLDFSCTAQLNTSIANSWGGSWTKNSAWSLS